MTKRYRLKKDLPDIKAGDIFQNFTGKYYVSSPSNFFYGYTYPKEVVENSPDWFEPIEDRWVPKQGEHFHYIHIDLDSFNFERYNTDCFHEKDPRHENFLSSGFCFKNHNQVIEGIRRIKETLLKYHEELDHE